MVAEGVVRGTVLLQGSIADGIGEYTGTAFIFSAKCGNRPYDVAGQLQNDGHQIAMSGDAPRVDRATCEPNGFKDDTLIFEFLRSDEPPVTFPPIAEGSICNTDLGEYRTCFETEANAFAKRARSLKIT